VGSVGADCGQAREGLPELGVDRGAGDGVEALHLACGALERNCDRGYMVKRRGGKFGEEDERFAGKQTVVDGGKEFFFRWRM
jgi:hypothetical protein